MPAAGRERIGARSGDMKESIPCSATRVNQTSDIPVACRVRRAFRTGARVRHDGGMEPRSPLRGLVVCLEDVDIDDLVGAAEVMVQEGLRTFSLPSTSDALPEFSGIFSSRARVGVHGVVTATRAAAAVEAGASFLLLDAPDADAVTLAEEAGVASYAQAMTPTEVRAVLELPVTGAMVYPADVLGHVMAHRLAALGLVDRVVARGGVGAYAAGEWLAAGAAAACVDVTLLSDALHGGDLGQLRDRCGSFVTAQDKQVARA